MSLTKWSSDLSLSFEYHKLRFLSLYMCWKAVVTARYLYSFGFISATIYQVSGLKVSYLLSLSPAWVNKPEFCHQE